jgi:hypothetical protein
MALFVLEAPFAAVEVLFGAPQHTARLALHPAETPVTLVCMPSSVHSEAPVTLVCMPSFVHSEAPEHRLEELLEDRASANVHGRNLLLRV